MPPPVRISANINLGVTSTPLPIVAVTPTAGQVDILDLILRLGQVLDEQNIPETGRWLVIPAWVATMIKKSELRQAYLSGDATSMLRNGRLGMVDRFTIYMCNLLPSGVAGGLAAGECLIYRRSRARAHLRQPDHQGGDDAVGADLRQLLRGLAGVRLQGARRHRDGPVGVDQALTRAGRR